MVMSNSPRQPLDPPDAPPRSPPPFLGSTRGHLLLGHFRPELLLENIQNYINLKLTTNWFVLELPGDLRRGKHQMEERRNTLNWSLVHSPGIFVSLIDTRQTCQVVPVAKIILAPFP